MLFPQKMKMVLQMQFELLINFSDGFFCEPFLTVCGSGTKEGKLYETVHCGVSADWTVMVA